MKNKDFLAPINTPAKLVASGAILIGLLQVPIMPALPEADSILPLQTAYVSAGRVEAVHTAILARDFFGEETEVAEVAAIVEKQKEFVSTRKAYPASLAVIQKHENNIRAKARKHGVPENVALGVGLLENGGSETAKSSAGAMGVFQLMPGTARDLGLTVNGRLDERRDPNKNIDAGMRYLARNYRIFGDWGLATWAYHAGAGNVSRALRTYAKITHGVELKGINQPQALREYVEKYNITIHKLLSEPEVRKFTNRLNDDSHGYPYKVVATANLFEEARVSALVGR